MTCLWIDDGLQTHSSSTIPELNFVFFSETMLNKKWKKRLRLAILLLTVSLPPHCDSRILFAANSHSWQHHYFPVFLDASLLTFPHFSPARTSLIPPDSVHRYYFDCSVTTCPHLPETLGQGASEMQLVKILLSLHSGSESMCGSLMPAVSSHYLIGIEMHLACVFVSTALLVEIPSLIPSPSLLDSYSCRLAERCFLSPVVWSNSLLHG